MNIIRDFLVMKKFKEFVFILKDKIPIGIDNFFILINPYLYKQNKHNRYKKPCQLIKK